RVLLQARAHYDPDGSDPAFDRMVLIGHSLGGLLAKVMAQDSRSRLWETVSAQPPDRLDGPAQAPPGLPPAVLLQPLPRPPRAPPPHLHRPRPPGQPSRSGCPPLARHATHPAWGPCAAGLCDPPGEQPARFLP